MQVVSYTSLRRGAPELGKLLHEEGLLVVTHHGRQLALLIDAQDSDPEQMVIAATRLRAQMAVASLRTSAHEHGLDQLTDDEIEAEVAAARAARVSPDFAHQVTDFIAEHRSALEALSRD